MKYENEGSNKDKLLFQHFFNNINNINFLVRKDQKVDIKNLISDILNNIDELEKYEESLSQFNIIPYEQKKKINKTRKLWKSLITEAFYCLRESDEADTNDFKDDFGILNIINYFYEFLEFEELLYGSDVYYRDHSLHVIRVFLLGFYLLTREQTKNSGEIINFQDLRIKNENDEIEIKLDNKVHQAIWAIISLTHDLGYPIEKIEKINQKINEIIKYYNSTGIEGLKYALPIQNLILNEFLLKFISSKIIKQKEEYFNVIQNKYFIKFSNAFEKYKHGIMSCILLLKYVTYFKESDFTNTKLRGFKKRDAEQFIIRRLILRSIASHDNDDIYHIFSNHYSFLLMLADDLQEWDRHSKFSRFKYSIDIDNIIYNDKKVKFDIIYDISRNLKSIDDIIQNFARNIKHYVRLFRSAPDSDKRNFKLSFKIKININANRIEILKFISSPKSEPKIISPMTNKEYDYLREFLQYIESNYNYKLIKEENNKISELIKKIEKKIEELKLNDSQNRNHLLEN